MAIAYSCNFYKTLLTDLPQIWMEESADIPQSLKQALSTDKQSHRLMLKSKGYTSNILTICETLDRNMKDLFDDLKIYLIDELDNRIPNNLTLEDRQRIGGFLKDASREGVAQYVGSLSLIFEF